jgi:hypothetical protein
MLYINLRYYASVFSYNIQLNDDKVKPITEIQIHERNQMSNSICLEVIDLRGFKSDHNNFICLPNCINIHFIRYFCKIPLSTISQLLRDAPCKGNNLLRFTLNNEVLMTDGMNKEKWQPMYDSRIKYSDRRSKYIRDPAIIINEKLLPLIISFLTPDINITYELAFSSDANIKEKYENSIYWEIIEQLIYYYSYFSQPSIVDSKYNFLAIILIITFVTQCKIKIEPLIDILTLVAPKVVTSLELIKYMTYIGLDFKESSVGELSYYTTSTIILPSLNN